MISQHENHDTIEDSWSSSETLPAASGKIPESLFLIMWRDRWIILLTMIAVLTAALVYVQMATPIYTSTSRIYVEQSGPKIMTATEEGIMTRGTNFLYTQAELLKSTPILVAAIEAPGIRQMNSLDGIDNIIEYLKKRLDASVGKKDEIISLSFDSRYPTEAAQLVNAIVDSYITYHANQKYGNTTEVLKILQKEKAKRDNELSRMLKAMTDFRKDHTALAFETKQGNVLVDEISSKLDGLERRHADLLRELTAEHPAVKAVETEIVRERQQVLNLNEQSSQYTILESNLEQIKKICDTLDNRIMELSVVEDTGALNISILEIARPADKPTKPAKARVMGIALILSIMLGGGLALLRQARDQRLHSAEEISAILGVPVLGIVPSMSKKETISARGKKLYMESTSSIAEAYRTIRTAVFFSTPKDTAKTILLTSPAPGDGKTTLASNLAIAMAQAGQHVLVLDADFRKPMQQSIFEISKEPGLSDVLVGRDSLGKVIRASQVSGLDILTCGSDVPNPSELLNSDAFGEMISELVSKYDRIIIDSPPVMPVTDACILAAICDVTILVLRAEKSSRGDAQQAREGLLSVGAHVLGVVINDVSNKKGRYGYYYGYGSYGTAYDNSPKKRSGQAKQSSEIAENV